MNAAKLSASDADRDDRLLIDIFSVPAAPKKSRRTCGGSYRTDRGTVIHIQQERRGQWAWWETDLQMRTVGGVTGICRTFREAVEDSGVDESRKFVRRSGGVA